MQNTNAERLQNQVQALTQPHQATIFLLLDSKGEHRGSVSKDALHAQSKMSKKQITSCMEKANRNKRQIVTVVPCNCCHKRQHVFFVLFDCFNKQIFTQSKSYIMLCWITKAWIDRTVLELYSGVMIGPPV